MKIQVKNKLQYILQNVTKIKSKMIKIFDKLKLTYCEKRLQRLHHRYNVIEENLEDSHCEKLDIENYESLENSIWCLSKVMNTICEIKNDEEHKVDDYIKKAILIHKKIISTIANKETNLMEVDIDELEYLTKKLNRLINSRL